MALPYIVEYSDPAENYSWQQVDEFNTKAEAVADIQKALDEPDEWFVSHGYGRRSWRKIEPTVGDFRIITEINFKIRPKKEKDS